MVVDLKTSVGRADLVRVLAITPQKDVAGMSGFLGYQSVDTPKKIEHREIKKTITKTKSPTSTEETVEATSLPVAQPGFWRVKSIEQDDSEQEVPDWVRNGHPITKERLRKKKKEHLKEQPFPYLVPWPRLWPFLKKVLSQKSMRGTVDAEKLVRIISEQKPIRRLPRKKMLKWAPSIHVLTDRCESTAMFWDDMDELVFRLSHICGKHRISEFVFPDGFGDECYSVRHKHRLAQYCVSEKKRVVLALGTMGGQKASSDYLETVCGISRNLHRYGGEAVALIPSPVAQWPNRVRHSWKCSVWDMGKKPRIVSSVINKELSQTNQASKKHDRAEQLYKFLSLCSPIVRFEPALIRFVRALLPVNQTDAAMETAMFSGAVVPRQQLHDFCKHPKSLKKSFIQLLYWFHENMPDIRAEEMQIIRSIDSEMNDFVTRITETDTINADIVASLYGKTWQQAEFCDSEFLGYLRRKEKRLPLKAFGDERIAAAWMLSHLDENGKIDVSDAPSTLPVSRLAWTMNAEIKRKYQIGQAGHQLIFVNAGTRKYSSPLCELHTPSNIAIVKDTKHGKGYSWNFDDSGPDVFSAPFESRVVQIEAVGATVLLEQIPKPTWADEIGRDKTGLYVQLNNERYYWLAPGMYSFVSKEPEYLEKGCWILEKWFVSLQRHGLISMSWYLDTLIERDYGVSRDFMICGVTQRFVWIPPGEFTMGSPKDEPERSPNEKQHDVVLTHGFWLADTTCTQELWKAVMGKNPSRFKGKNKPVEKVSWDDCQEFIKKVHNVHPDLNISLPTEAQWEYACRAGTKTPFSFGKNITPAEVNYNGDYPYDDGAKGEVRGETVDGEMLPQNPWGLYQMHGNVWEWCSDWYGDYPTGKIANPKGPEKGVYRVLRGGSWYSNGEYCRSAYRFCLSPGSRDFNTGFRFSLGQVAQARAAGPRGEESEVKRSETVESTSEKRGLLGKLFGSRKNKK